MATTAEAGAGTTTGAALGRAHKAKRAHVGAAAPVGAEAAGVAVQEANLPLHLRPVPGGRKDSRTSARRTQTPAARANESPPSSSKSCG